MLSTNLDIVFRVRVVRGMSCVQAVGVECGFCHFCCVCRSGCGAGEDPFAT